MGKLSSPLLMDASGRIVQEELLRGEKMKVSPWRRPCATSSPAPRQQATAVGNAATPLCDLVAAVTAPSHSIYIMLKSWRKPVSRQSQRRQPCSTVSTNTHTATTPPAARLTCASLLTWDVLIACVDEDKEVTMCELKTLSSLRFPCRR